MKIVNLVSWAGENFSYIPGDVVEIDDEIGAARIEAGLASAVDAAQQKWTRLDTAVDVTIPENWKTLSATDVKAIAAQLASPAAANRNEALTVIEAELKFRGA
jgi:predicted phage tail protein